MQKDLDTFFLDYFKLSESAEEEKSVPRLNNERATI